MSELALWAVLVAGAGVAVFGILSGGSDMGPTVMHDEPPASTDGPRGDILEHVEMENLKFEPARLDVPAGTTVTWTNHDPFEHTVTPADAAQWGTSGSGDEPSSWLDQGESWSFTFDEPGTFVYYCIPHASKASDGSYRGMTGTIVVAGPGGSGDDDPRPAPTRLPSATVVPDPVAPARTLPGSDGIVHVELEAREVLAQLADGSAYEFWTFGDTVPGPMLRVREGDTVELTLRNAGDSALSHSIDLHAVTGPGGGSGATQTPPGGSSSFTFKALNPGLYVYHCATSHIPSHVANGMYGLILVEPEVGLPPVDREYYVVQGEIYTQQELGSEGVLSFSVDKLLDEEPEYYLLNGRVGALTGAGALTANVGETVRIYFGVGGFVPSSFHVIGEIFDRVYPEGGFPAVENVQTTLVPAGGATMVEFAVEVPGTYLLVDHWLTHAIDRGAAGHLVVSGEPDPEVFDDGGATGSGH